MAEVTGLRSNALNYPAYAAPYGVTFPILDADGDLVTGAAGLDSEISKNGDTFADCTNEATEIATSSGMYYLLLTATELTTDVATIIVKTSTVGAKTTPMVLYPRKLVTFRSGTAAGGATGSITLDSGASAVDDAYNGCLVVGTLDSTVEARIITDYVGSTKVASVTPDWVTTPDSDDTFIIYIPEGMQMPFADLRAIGGLGVDGNNATLKLKQLDVTNSAGTAVVMASTGSNGNGIAASGNGAGAGIVATGGGTSGNGITAQGGSTNGSGLYANGVGSGHGLYATADATGHGINATGGSTSAGGSGINATGRGTAGAGITGAGSGTGAGLSVTGGATGVGLKAVGGATSGAGGTFTGSAGNANGATFTANGSGKDIAAPNSDLSGTLISSAQVVASVTGAVGSVAGSVGSIATGGISAASFAANAIDAAALATSAVDEIVDGTWDEAIAGHLSAGSTGLALNSAGSAGDPWSTALPGAYASGTAGHIVGTALPDIAPGSANGLLRGGTNAATSITTALTANIIGNITGNLSGSVGSVSGNVGGNVVGTVASVTGNVAGNVTGSVGSVLGNVGGNVVGSTASVTAGVTVTTNNDKTGYTLSSTGVDGVWDEVIEGSTTARQSVRLANSANGAIVAGAATATVTIRDLGDTKDRVTAFVDVNGNRTAVSLDLT